MNTVGGGNHAQYYRQSAAAVIEALQSHKMGLTNATAGRRQTEQGANVLPELETSSWLAEQLRAAMHPLTLGLVLATGLAVVTAQTWLALIILAIAALDSRLRTAAQHRSQTSGMPAISVAVLVVRNGQRRRLEAAQLVPGDIIKLSAGDITPADARLLTVNEFVVDESALFTKNTAVTKTTRSLRAEITPIKQTNMVWQGTRVTSGKAAAIVTATGAQTELGRTVVLANTVRRSSVRNAWPWSPLWYGAGLLLVLVAAAGWLLGVDSPAVLQGLLVLDLATLPAGFSLAYFVILLRNKPRADAPLALLTQLAQIDTVVTRQPQVARFKAFGLRVLHVGYGSGALPDDVSQWHLGAGSATLPDLTAANELRLVLAAQANGQQIAVIGSSWSDLPAQIQSAVAAASRNDLAALLAAAQAAAALARQLRGIALANSVALTLLAVMSLAGQWLNHWPLAISPSLILIYALIVVPIGAFGLQLRAQPIRMSELLAHAAATSLLAYAVFLSVFGLKQVDPSFIDPTNPLVGQALTATFAMLVLCQLINLASTASRRWYSFVIIGAVNLFVLLVVAYNPQVQPLAGSAGLDLTAWLLTLTAALVYVLFALFLRHTRRHSRAAIIGLYHSVYGRSSPARI